MGKTSGSIRLAGRHLVVAVAVTLLPGCGGDGLLLPGDGAPAELRMVSGDQQSAPAGDRVPDPLIVQAVDAAGRPVQGAAVVFEFVNAPTGARLAPANAETDEAGRAYAEATLGTPAGDQQVEARLDGSAADLKVRFRLTALQPRRGGGAGDGNGGDGGRPGGGGSGEGDDDDDEGD
jgi:hypothetical protein